MPFKFSIIFLLFSCRLVTAEHAPSINLDALNKKMPVDLQHYSGKTVLLDFWASWCAPCLKSLPIYQQWHEKEKITVVSINLDEQRLDALKMINALGLTFPVAYDEEKNVARAYGVLNLPVAFLIGKDGEIALRHDGFKIKDVSEILLAIEHLNSP